MSGAHAVHSCAHKGRELSSVLRVPAPPCAARGAQHTSPLEPIGARAGPRSCTSWSDLSDLALAGTVLTGGVATTQPRCRPTRCVTPILASSMTAGVRGRAGPRGGARRLGRFEAAARGRAARRYPRHRHRQLHRDRHGSSARARAGHRAARRMIDVVIGTCPPARGRDELRHSSWNGSREMGQVRLVHRRHRSGPSAAARTPGAHALGGCHGKASTDRREGRNRRVLLEAAAVISSSPRDSP